MTTPLSETPERGAVAEAAALPPIAWRPVLAVAGALLAILVAVSGRYGPHRDELYFVSAGRRLAWGYPDQPPLTPLLARLTDLVAPGSLVALHLPAALMVTGVVLLSALTARELGAGSSAQVLTAVTIATGAVVAVAGHMLSTTTTDLLVWVGVVLLAMRALRADRPRWWLPVGVVAGVGLLDKHLVVFLLAGIALGVALTSRTRHHLRSGWTWAGVGIAALLGAPNLLWQAAHGWPQLTLAADIRDEYAVLEERIGFVVLLLLLLSPLAAALWAYGWRRLWRVPELTWARPFAWAAAVLAVVFLATGGKAYYLAGLLPLLVASGADGLARAWSPARVRRAGWALAVAGLVAWPVALPLLPASVFASTGLAAVGEDQAEMIGWPELVDTVRTAAADSGATLVVTGNYGEAGALEWYGSPVPVYSGHNGFAEWGPPPDSLTGPVVLVGYPTAPSWASGCRAVARIDNAAGVQNEERGGPVLVCTGPTAPWSEIWDRIAHLSA